MAEGVYSNTQIKQAVKEGHIVVQPYSESNLSGSSYDVTLGEWYYRTERDSQKGVYNPLSEEDVSRYFDGPHQAEPHADWCKKNHRPLFENIPQDHLIIVLKPGERILAHTHEFIGIKAPGTSTMQARSTWGRNGVAVCLDAGWGDPGYINRWTMEVYNMNQHESVVLPVGERIAQMVFYHTGPVEGEYSQISGKYQPDAQAQLESIMSKWQPKQMLPRAFKDQRMKLVEIGVDSSFTESKTELRAERVSPPTKIGDLIAQKSQLVVKNDDGSYSITTAGKEYLADAVTDIEGNVYGFYDKLSNPTIAAAMARLSRRGDDMRVTILDEFVGQKGKDEDLLKRVITAFGDDSVQQLTSIHMVVERTSNIMTKKLEWGRLASYLEQSTRYIYFDQTDAKGNYRYYTPKNLSAEMAKTYENTMNQIFKTYSKMVRQLTEYCRTTSKVKKSERDGAFNAATRAQACDAIRPVLPVATTSTVGIHASGQALEALIMRLLSDPLQEARDIGQKLLKEARKIIPVFLERADKPERGGATTMYMAKNRENITKLVEKEVDKNISDLPDKAVQLVEYWPRQEFDLLPYMLYEQSNQDLETISSIIDKWDYKKKLSAFNLYIGERLNRRHKPGRALEKAHYTFDLVCDYGIFRDLQRHRMVDALMWQKLTPRYGYEVPELVEKAGLADDFNKCFDLSLKLYSKLQDSGYELEAQYATLLGNRMRWTITYNARQAFHLHELRTSPQGHPGYRKLVSMMHEQLAAVHPIIADAMKFVNKAEDPELTRLAAEKYTQFKLRKLDMEKEK